MKQKLAKLKQILKNMGSALIAYSGGVDSTFLIQIAHDVLKDKAVATTATSSTYPAHDLADAKKFIKKLGIKHIFIETNELENPQFIANPPERCYFCKKELLQKLKEIAKKENIAHVLVGSNYDDIKDFRPGRKATQELGARSPLEEVGLTKEEIRKLSKERGLSTWNKPASPCLASRLPYGTKITEERLKQISAAEKILKDLGFPNVRVRHHSGIARIEVPKEDIFPLVENFSSDITHKFNALGFNYITVDLKGFRSGSLNEVLLREPESKPLGS